MVVAGGMESMTNAPYLIPKAREGYRLGHGEVLDSMIHDGLWCAFENWPMGEAAEVAFQTILETAPRLNHVRRIRFVLHGERDREVHEKALARILGQDYHRP